MKKIIVGLIVLSFAIPATAQKTWDGGGDGSAWEDAGNWDPDGLPTGSDDVIVNAPGTTIIGYEMNVSDLFDTLDWQDGTYQGSLYYGYVPSTELKVSGGLFQPGWFQVGRNHDATMTQTGGEVITGAALNLGEVDFPGYGTYNMNGGYLEILGIAVYSGEFNFSGGTIQLNGNQLPFNVSNARFSVTGPNAANYFETYDAGENITTLGFVQIIGVIHSNGATVVRENGETDSFEVVLLEAPDAEVTVTVDPEDPNDDFFLNAEAPNDAITLTFTTANWDTPQSVTVTAVDDDEPEPTEVKKIVITGDSTDTDFQVTTQTAISIIDDDSANVIIEQSDGSTDVVEGGATDSYTVVLGFAPNSDVTITIDDSGDPNQTTVDGGETTTLTFTPTNWDTPQTVTVEAIDDDVPETDPHNTTLTYSVSQPDGDNAYDGLAVTNVSVSIGENDCGAGPFDVSDYDENCITDLSDFAQFSASFLNCSISSCI